MATRSLQLRIVGGYWTTTWYDANGKRRCKRFGNAKRVARTEAVERFGEFHKAWIADATIRDRTPGASATVRQLADAYATWADGYYRKPSGRLTGEARNVADAIATATGLFGRTRATDVTPADLRACQAAMIAKGLARGTINARVNRIRRVFRWGVENGMVRAETWYGLKAVTSLARGRTEARETEPVKPVPDADLEATRGFLTAPLRGMVDLQLVTGMRPGEVRTMRPVDIDMTGPIWKYTPTEHKTEHHGRPRTICLGPKAQEIIRPFLNRRVDTCLFDPREALQEQWAACATHRHQPTAEPKTARKVGDLYTSNSYIQAIGDACRKAGVSHWTPNRLRHNCATRLREKFGIEAARAILGHAKLGTTEIYAEIDADKSERIMAEVG